MRKNGKKKRENRRRNHRTKEVIIRGKPSRIELNLRGEYHELETGKRVYPEPITHRPVVIDYWLIQPDLITEVVEREAPEHSDYYMPIPGKKGRLIQYYKKRTN